MAFSLAKALGAGSALGLAISLAACGPDDTAVKDAGHFALGEVSGPFDWPMDGADGRIDSLSSSAYGDWMPLGAARPLVTRVSNATKYAPAWDYPEGYDYDAPEFASYSDGYYEDGYRDAGYYEEGYYDSPYFEEAYYGSDYDWYDRSPDTDSYALLALAAVLGGVIGNSPPDYYFDYGGVQPWVWITGDRYVRYAEPLPTGYRYYYYAPDAASPFLVRDPLYTYGYSGDRLVVIYDSYGRVLNRDRALRLRRAASSYYDRGVTLYDTGLTSERYGVAAPLWQQRSATLAADQQQWDRARHWSPGWTDWDKRYDEVADKHWQRERIARTYAAKRFAAWQKQGFRSPAPEPGRELRARSNPYKAVLQQAAIETRKQDMARLARFERGKASQDNVARLSRDEQQMRRGSQIRTVANRNYAGSGERGVRAEHNGRTERVQDGSRARMAGPQRDATLRAKHNGSRPTATARQVDRLAEHRTKAIRNQQSAGMKRDGGPQNAERIEAAGQRAQKAERQQQARIRQQQASSQQMMKARAHRQQQVERQQQEVRRQQMAAQRQQQAGRQQHMARQQQQQVRREQVQAQRQQQMARQQQAQAQRQQQMANQQRLAERHQQFARQQQAQAQRQQQIVGQQQQAARQQQSHNLAAGQQGGQGGQGRGNGHHNR